MEQIEIVEKLMAIFVENGLLVDDPEALIIDYVPDSITFIQLIISIEEVFDLELPDDLLLMDNMGTTIGLAMRIKELMDALERK